jgi:hypothetical protein
MTKVPFLTAIMLVTLTGTGLASREWRPVSEPTAVIEPHDMHLRYYEEIRPLLASSTASREKLCRGEASGGER